GFLPLGQSEIEEGVVMIDHVDNRFETAVVVETALIGRTHKQTTFLDKQTRHVLSLVGMVRRAIGFDAVDSDLSMVVKVPTEYRPQRLHVANSTLCFRSE